MADRSAEARRELAKRELARRQNALKAGSRTPTDSGIVFPISRDDQGAYFDADAGIMGAAKRALTLPSRVMSGETPIRDAQGKLTDEVIQGAADMAAFTTPMNPMVRSGDKAIAGVARNFKKAKVDPPSTEALFKAASKGYDDMRATGAEYAVRDVQNMALRAKSELEQAGMPAVVAKKTHKILDLLTRAPEGAVADINGLHAAYKTLGKLGGNYTDPTDQKAALLVKEALGNFIAGQANSANPAAATAGQLLRGANGNFAAAKRSELIGANLTSAQRRAAAANSGQNIGNTIRSKAASALDSPKKLSGFNQKERAALEDIVAGSPAANITRASGNYLGGGGGLGALSASAFGGTIGAWLGGGPGGAAVGATLPVLAGASLKKASNKITESALKEVGRGVRMRSPLYNEMARNAPNVAKGPTVSNAAIKATLAAEGPTKLRAFIEELMDLEKQMKRQSDQRFNPQRNPNAA